jgi:glucose-6-phosphate 1-dehydrogenase
MNIFYWTC